MNEVMVEPVPDEAPAAGVLPGLRRVVGWVSTYLGLALVVGGLGGLFWVRVVTLPTYAVGADGAAIISERGLAEVFATDAWFALLGLLVGVGLGMVAWRWFATLGWPVALIALVGALAAGLICWATGALLGPGDLVPRLAAAGSGDLVPIAFELRSPSALAVWPLAALLPILLTASLGRDEEVPRPPRRRRWVQHAPGSATDRGEVPVSDSGEVVGRDLDLLPPSAG